MKAVDGEKETSERMSEASRQAHQLWRREKERLIIGPATCFTPPHEFLTLDLKHSLSRQCVDGKF
jgi:hypothetical protein